MVKQAPGHTKGGQLSGRLETYNEELLTPTQSCAPGPADSQVRKSPEVVFR